MTAPFVTAGAGFLLAVLWFDLMFDVQVVRHRGATIPQAVLDSIAAYYARVTTAARPMNRLVALAMLGTIAAIVVQIGEHDASAWAAWTSAVLIGAAVLLAGFRTVPSARRLGSQRDEPQRQQRMTRAIFADHVFCAVAVVALLAIQLGCAA